MRIQIYYVFLACFSLSQIRDSNHPFSLAFCLNFTLMDLNPSIEDSNPLRDFNPRLDGFCSINSFFHLSRLSRIEIRIHFIGDSNLLARANFLELFGIKIWILSLWDSNLSTGCWLFSTLSEAFVLGVRFISKY